MSGVATALSGLAKRGLALVYPEVCQLCHDESAQPADGYVGTDCLEKMKPIEAPFCRRCGQPFEGEITGEFECTNCREMKLRFEFARGVMRGSPEMMDVVHRFKYQQALWLEPLFSAVIRRDGCGTNPLLAGRLPCAGAASSGTVSRARVQPGGDAVSQPEP